MKIIAFIAEGSEDTEFVTTTAVLKRAGIEILTVSIMDEIIVSGSLGTKIMADKTLSMMMDEDIYKYDGIFFPGGVRGVKRFKDNKRILDIIRKFNDLNKYILAICAAPSILDKAGIIKEDTLYTVYDGYEEKINKGKYIKASAISSSNIYTGRSAGYSIDLALLFIKNVLKEDKYNQIKNELLWEK